MAVRVQRFSYLLMLLALLLPLSWGSTYQANAQTSEVLASTYIAENDANISQIVSNSNEVGRAEILGYDGSTGIVTFNYKLYNQLKDKKKFMKEALEATAQSGLGTQRRNKLYNFIAEQDGQVSAAVAKLRSDTSADFYRASVWLRPFTTPLSTFLGFMAFIIFALMSLSIVFDLSFITLPVFRNVTQDYKKGSFLISNDARKAMMAEDNNGEVAIIIWLKRRAISLFVLSLLMLYLITGSIFDLLGWFLVAFNVG